jgi:hypothetical protein
LVPFPGTPLYRRLAQQGRLLAAKWWLDAEGRVGDVTFQPKRMNPRELQDACLWARREFYGWSSMWQRSLDTQANLSSLAMFGVYIGLNVGSHFDIDLRQGLQLGLGPNEPEPLHDPLPVRAGYAGG